MRFTEEQLQRYSRQILLPEVGGKGQKKIAEAKVFLVGAGGLGSPSALYLAAAGVGTLGIIDNDTVDLSNLQRQVLHSVKTIGHPKALSAAETLSKINPDVKVVPYQDKLTAGNILQFFSDYDIIVDGSDNFSTRFLVNDAAFFLKKTLVSASIFRFDGQLTVLKPYTGNHPCYRCLYPEPPPAGLVPSCQEAGVLGILAGTMGVLQSAETLKEILGIGESLAGRLLIYDALSLSFRKVKIPKNPKCPLCSENPTITKLMEYEAACALR
ncbi:MAG: molybdopterin-synthase adenylyltransferase MoeB [Nitrospirota bacterium]